MNTNLLFLSTIHLILSIFIGVMVLYLSYYFTLKVFNKKNYEIDKSNFAFGIFMSSILLSVGIIVSTAYAPSMSLIQLLQKSTADKTELFLEFSKYFLMFLGIALVVSFLIVIISVRLYNMLTKNIKELKEISENNMAIALITGVMIIVVALFAKDSVGMIIESLLPYPEVSLIY
jgi:uncharacterized membrane protein YjfL (UPF0719 family)